MNSTDFFRSIAELCNGRNFEEANRLLTENEQLYNQSSDFWFYTGVILFNTFQYEEAIAVLKKAYEINPTDIRIHFNLGICCSRIELYADAMGWFKKVIAVQPENISALLMISAIFDVTGNPGAGEKTCRIILKLDPNNVSALNNLGNSCKNSGKSQDAVEYYSKALSINPSVDMIRSNLLFALNYNATDPVKLKGDHERLANVWCKPSFTFLKRQRFDKRLRIGLISPDFCSHSVAYFLTGLFTELDRSRFFIASYANVEHPDDRTEWFKSQSDHWVDTTTLSQVQKAEKIYTDQIDILIDLAGHTGGSNCGAMGLKPAPIQITWLGYPATTGMNTIDWRFSDYFADPEGVDSHYTENLLRLPHFLNYTPKSTLPELNFSDFESRDHIVFGSFNNIAKLSEETIRLWSGVLIAVPNSKLLIKHKYFNDPAIQEIFFQRFKSAGIAQERLIFHSFNFTDLGHLEEYNYVDIALDSWPYNGTTTTFEALIMGVPTLTMTGNVHASRVGNAIMSGIGLPQFVTSSPVEFAARAAELTADRNDLLEFKKGLREHLLASPLCDSKTFTRNFEEALLALWENYNELTC